MHLELIKLLLKLMNRIWVSFKILVLTNSLFTPLILFYHFFLLCILVEIFGVSLNES